MNQPQLNLYNTLTRQKEPFKALDVDNEGSVKSVGLYVCGITPYDFAHIGNLRTMVVFDVLYRLLAHLYPNVNYVRNYTDIDDKIVERANERNMEPFALAAEFIEIFERDMAAMQLKEPTHKPRVSQHMEGIVAMVNGLLEKGFAYITQSGDVMFDVPAFERLGKPHDTFGHLARRVFDNVQARVEEDAEKRDPRDFPIWKANAKSATKMEQAFSPTELGATHPNFTAPGRPGWHIECSVMAQSILNPHPQAHTALIDIHGGGEDLAFPHHSCEIAQSEAFNPTCTMSSIWMHVAFLTVEGQKMSKSLDNFVLVSEALKKYSPEAIRLWLLQTHYRKPVDYSDEALTAAENRIKRWQREMEIRDNEFEEAWAFIDKPINMLPEVIAPLFDDLDTPKLLSNLDGCGNILYQHAIRSLLGIAPKTKRVAITVEAHQLVIARDAARTNKDWPESDRLRNELTALGYIVEDGADGKTRVKNK